MEAGEACSQKQTQELGYGHLQAEPRAPLTATLVAASVDETFTNQAEERPSKRAKRERVWPQGISRDGLRATTTNYVSSPAMMLNKLLIDFDKLPMPASAPRATIKQIKPNSIRSWPDSSW
jgi:hypothetical protein